MNRSTDDSNTNVRRAHRLRTKDILNSVSIIDDRLFFMLAKCRPKVTSKKHFFTVDKTLRYEAFFIDFGPLNLACLFKFCMLLNAKLQDKSLEGHAIYFYTDRDANRIANASFLIGSYMVLFLGYKPKEAFQIIEPLAVKANPFRDASMGVCTYKCTVEHCIKAVYQAKRFRFLDFDVFNVDEYEYYERVECGDFNVIVPGKFIAFAGPSATNIDVDGYPALTPTYYIPIWKKFRVSTIVRLNKKCYDKRRFSQHGFEHYDLYYTDGSCPSRAILKKFLQICENAPGVIAVHCKAGLGRTGSCVGCYMMKHYGWTASEVIAWMRICRPGSVIGPQQHFLEEQQPIMWKEGNEYRATYGTKLPVPREPSERYSSSTSHQRPSDSPQSSSRKPLPTDPGQDQGRALRAAKRSPRVKSPSRSNPPLRTTELPADTNLPPVSSSREKGKYKTRKQGQRGSRAGVGMY